MRRVDGERGRAPGRAAHHLASGRPSSCATCSRAPSPPGGTASEVAIPGYELAGKTGTANKIDATTGEYSKSRYIASFIGFAPALHPKLLVGVVVDEPQGDIYGGQVAAPAFGKITSFALSYLRHPAAVSGAPAARSTLLR